MTRHCAVERCIQPADWSAWWEVYLCHVHLIALTAGDVNEFDEADQDLDYYDYPEDDPSQVPGWLAANLQRAAHQ